MLPLKNILFVLELTRNLLSVNQLTTQHPVNCEFCNENSCVNDRTTGQKMMTGVHGGDLYQNYTSQADTAQALLKYGTNIWDTLKHLLYNY